MSIRIIWIVSLLAILALVLYVPSAYPPERFVAQLTAEHERNADFWGEQRAINILSRMLEFQVTTKDANRLPHVQAEKPATGAVQTSVEREMGRATARLFDSQYFKSIDTLLALAAYRLSALMEWLPYLAAFMCAALIDGSIRRRVKSKEFLHHSPELFALHAVMVILVACGTFVSLVLPVTVHPFLFVIAPVVVAGFAGASIANFHRRG